MIEQLNKKTQYIFALIFALTISGYPLAGLLSIWLNLESRNISISFRIVVVLLSLVLILLIDMSKCQKPNFWLISFWTIYLMRLTWDIYLQGITSANSAMLFFVVTTLIPVSSIIYGSAAWNDRIVTWTLFTVCALVCIGGVGLQTLGGYDVDRSLTSEIGRLSFDTVNPITFGHVGVTSLITAIPLWFFTENLKLKVLVVIGSFFGLLCVVLAVSRGPFVSLAVCFVVFCFIHHRRFLFIFLVMCAIALIMKNELGLAPYLSNLIEIMRFTDFISDQSNSERLLIQKDAILQFWDNPMIGSAFIELYSKEYPHNIIIETAMSLGIVGITILFVILLQAGRLSFALMKNGYFLLPLLFFQYITGSQFSGALWGIAAFWTSTALVLASKDRVLYSTKQEI